MLHLSSAPTSEEDRLVRRNVVLRSFAVRSGGSYTAMLGGLARVTDDNSERRGVLVTEPNGQLAKDVWVVGSEPVAAPRIVPRGRAGEEPGFVPAVSASIAMVPRVLSDLYWFGRYAERAEDLLRLVLATRTVAIETDLDVTQGRALEVLLQAVTHIEHHVPRLPQSAGRDDAGVPIDAAGSPSDGHCRSVPGSAVDGGTRRTRPALRGRLDGAGRHRAGPCRAVRQSSRSRSSADRRQRASAVRFARAGGDRDREHGPRSWVVHARLRSRAGARIADPGAAAGDASAGSERPTRIGWCWRRCSPRPNRS